MKKLLLILLIITTGCIKYTDLNNLSIIKNIGISYQNNNYTIYAKIFDEVKKDNKPKTKIIKANGKSITEAFNNMKALSNKEIFLSHIDLLILDPNLNDDNYKLIIDFALNNNLRNDFKCFFSKNIESLLKNSQIDEIETYLKTNKETKRIINKNFNEIINDYLNNKTFSLTMISYNKEIKFHGNYKYHNNKIERISNEQN